MRQESQMPPELIFLIQLVLGYVACLLCFYVYALPKLKSMSRFEAQRVIATVHSCHAALKSRNFTPLSSIYVRYLTADSLHLNTGMMH
jgi:hypothetical protein